MIDPMRKCSFLTLCVALAFVVGCSGDSGSKVADKPGKTNPDLQIGESQSPDNPKPVQNKVIDDPAPVPTPKPTPSPNTDKVKPNKPTINVKVAPPKSGGWHPTKITLAQLASRIGDSVKSLKNVKADTITLARTAEGEGEYKGIIAIQDSKNYHVDYIVIDSRPLSATDVSDGRFRMIRLDEKWSPVFAAGKPLGVAHRTGVELAAQWPIDFSRMVFQGLTDGKDAWGPIAAAWSKGANGFQAIVEERQMDYNGRQVTNYRVRAERPAATAKKLGAATTEIVVDGTRYLPVTIRIDRTDEKGNKWMSQWSARWKFNQVLKPEDFKMPIPR